MAGGWRLEAGGWIPEADGPYLCRLSDCMSIHSAQNMIAWDSMDRIHLHPPESIDTHYAFRNDDGRRERISIPTGS